MNLLLVNPPVYDFAAYSLWARPVGLLKIASMLNYNKINFDYFDFLDISKLKKEELKKNKIKIKKSGRHTYPKEEIEKPKPLKSINRKFYRFGLKRNLFYKFLNTMEPPDYVIITSVMTYWYLGVKEVISIIREVFPESKIILGGIYANLCKNHALKLGVDSVVNTIADIVQILNLKNIKEKFFPLNLKIYNKNYFAPIYTSFGCPFSCVYCANKFLNKVYCQRNIDEIINEILYYYENFKIKNFAFYDDALLINKEKHFIPLFKKIIDLNLDIKFYCPNGLHISEIDKNIAFLMKKANFMDLRLSLETSNEILQKKLGYKTDNKSFIKAVTYLKQANFTKENISVYLLVGLPHQKIDEIYSSIKFAKKFDVKVKLAEYSPIPHTKLWNESKLVAKYDIENEPLFHNNKILPVAHKDLTIDALNKIKQFAHKW
jgi:radical SAM superfamily enzyme YgiQ (UPF0313 family)